MLATNLKECREVSQGRKKNQFECPYQDSNLGRRGIAVPQHDDLTTNLYGPKSRAQECIRCHKRSYTMELTRTAGNPREFPQWHRMYGAEQISLAMAISGARSNTSGLDKDTTKREPYKNKYKWYR